MLLVTSLLAAAGLGILFFALASPYKRVVTGDVIDDRVAFYGISSEAVIADELERLSFQVRIVQPQLQRLQRLIARLTPTDYFDRIEGDLAAAGNPSGLTATLYLSLRLVLVVVGAALGLAIGLFLGPLVAVLAGALVGAFGAWFGMRLWLRQVIADRRRRVRNALPDVIDFLVVAVDAGLAFDTALNRVVVRFENALTEGFKIALSEVSLGRGRLEALEDFGRRTQVPEVMAFVAMVVSSERLGVPIAFALRIQAQDLRWRRGEWAREEAGRAPVRMTIPMVLLIFPTIWLILLGPSLVHLLTTGL
jgi:tight adherence protein C